MRSGPSARVPCQPNGRLERLVGIDLNEAQITENRARNGDRRIEWVAASAVPWLKDHARGPAVFFSNAGVLEYFPPTDLSALLTHLAKQTPPIIYGLIEPIDPSFDFDQEATSRVFGAELTFSHNYPRIFESHGFEIRFRVERKTEGDRILLMVASLR